MFNNEIKAIINEEITAAKLSEDVSVNVTFHGNGAFILAEERHLFNQSYNVTRCGVTTTEQDTHYEYHQLGFGTRVWGIQGAQRVRKAVRQYLAEVAM